MRLYLFEAYKALKRLCLFSTVFRFLFNFLTFLLLILKQVMVGVSFISEQGENNLTLITTLLQCCTRSNR